MRIYVAIVIWMTLSYSLEYCIIVATLNPREGRPECIQRSPFTSKRILYSRNIHPDNFYKSIVSIYKVKYLSSSFNMI